MIEQHDVLVVGAAVTGLSTAVFLAAHGHAPLVVERHPDTLSHPRSRGINPRTAEIYRQIGLEPQLWEEASLATDFSKLLMLRAETLSGEEIFSAPTDQPDPTGSASPCEWIPIDQDRLEHVLRARAREQGVQIRFGTELVGLRQDTDGVEVDLVDRGTGQRSTVRTRYLVAADGGRSCVRHLAGIDVDGPGEFATSLSMLFEADLDGALRGRPVGVCYLDRPSPQTVLFAHDGQRRWIFATGLPAGQELADVTEEQCVAMIRAAIGDPDLPVTLLPQLPAGGATVLSFWIGAQVARRYRDGRVFLVGDAAHLVPPTGGFGASLGIQDGHNLAWKLAGVLSGTAAPALLDSYETERRPVAWATVEQTMLMMQDRTGRSAHEGSASDGTSPAEAYAATVFGYRYGSTEPPLPPTQLHGEPGTRAPHVVLERDGEEISTLDLYGRHPVLLTGAAGGAWADAAGVLTGAPLDVYVVGGDGASVTDPGNAFVATYGIAPDGAVLVRPDGFVSWRSRDACDDPAAELGSALRRLAGRA